MKVIFGKYVDNNSFLTKVDVRIKLFITLLLMVISFFNLNFYVYLGYFLVVLLITLLAKLSLKPILTFFKNTWVLITIILIINLLVSGGSVLFSIGKVNVYLNGIVDTAYIVLRILMILMISSLLTSSSRPSELTYGMEFYLKPLKFTGVDTHEIALMMSIAIRFVPTLLEEADRIMKAQTSRGADFEHGKLVDKMSATTSLIVPLFMSCFEKSVDLSEAMVVRGYGIGKRSEYPRKKNIFLDTLVIIVIVLFIVSLFVINGVI